MGGRGRKQTGKRSRQRRWAAVPPPRAVGRYPTDSLIEALLVGMLGRRAADEKTGGGAHHVWGFGCVDGATAHHQIHGSLTSADILDGSVLDFAFTLQPRWLETWGYGLAYCGWMGSLVPGAPMPPDARTAFAENSIGGAFIPELMFAAVIFDARARMHTTFMPLFAPEVRPTFTHTDISSRADDFAQAFREDGAIDADLWFAALALDADRNQEVLHRALPEIMGRGRP